MTLPPKPLRPLHLRRAAALAAAAALVIAPAPFVRAQESAAAPASAQAPAVTPEMEAKLVATLAKATFQGRWTGIKDGQLSAEKDDTYHIVSASKTGGDKWTVNARMTYGGKSLVLPIPVRVWWAGDTPVLVVDNLTLGIGPTYSARVMIYDGTYSGSWSGGGRAGLLSGLITNEKE